MAKGEVEAILRRGVAEIIVEADFRRLLESGRSLRLKMGFDPTRPDIHLGHVVGLRKLRQLQDLGHRVILIVGDWTARIGDPSGQSATRPMLTEEEVKANAETYLKQFFKVVDREKTEVAWQSQWFDAFTLAEVIRLASRFTVAQLLARDDFHKRYTSGQPLALHEMLYPLLQAYDSVAIQADVEFGGTDQKFNLLLGRELQAMMGQAPQQCFLVPILAGTDGVQKMSKSLDNYIAIDEPAWYIDPETRQTKGMYGHVMSIPDSLILPYLELLTDFPEDVLAEHRRSFEQGVNPMEVKKVLAWQIVFQFHGYQAAEDAFEHFEQESRQRQMPEKVEEFRVSFEEVKKRFAPVHLRAEGSANDVQFHPEAHDDLWSALRYPDGHVSLMPVPVDFFLSSYGLVKSRSEARRKLAEGAIELDGVKVLPGHKRVISHGSILKIGKRRFVRIINTDAQKTGE